MEVQLRKREIVKQEERKKRTGLGTFDSKKGKKKRNNRRQILKKGKNRRTGGV